MPRSREQSTEGETEKEKKKNPELHYFIRSEDKKEKKLRGMRAA